MGVFENFPYTNFHDLNLDWILRTMKDLDKEVREYIQNNKIQFADPIVWNIQSQYPANTLVTDPENNIVYLSRQAVPTGIALANTDYWQAVFTLQALWDAVDNVMESVAPINQHSNTQAQQQMEVNELFWLNHNLYIVTAQILRGQQIGSGNSRRVTIEEMLLQAQSYLTQKINKNTDDIEATNTRVDNWFTEAEPTITNAVDNWLKTNLTETAPTIDSTLSISGAGSDSYITGAVLLHEFFGNFGTVSTVPYNKGGFINYTGAVDTSSPNENYTDYIEVPANSGVMIQACAASNHKIAIYDTNKALINFVPFNDNEYGTTIDSALNYIFIYIEQAGYIRASLGNNIGKNIWIVKNVTSQALITKINSLNTHTQLYSYVFGSSAYKTEIYPAIGGGYINASGEVDTYLPNENHSDYLPVSAGDGILIDFCYSGTRKLAVYDSNKNFLYALPKEDNIYDPTSIETRLYYLTIEQNGYIRASLNIQYNKSIYYFHATPDCALNTDVKLTQALSGNRYIDSINITGTQGGYINQIGSIDTYLPNEYYSPSITLNAGDIAFVKSSVYGTRRFAVYNMNNDLLYTYPESDGTLYDSNTLVTYPIIATQDCYVLASMGNNSSMTWDILRASPHSMQAALAAKESSPINYNVGSDKTYKTLRSAIEAAWTADKNTKKIINVYNDVNVLDEYTTTDINTQMHNNPFRGIALPKNTIIRGYNNPTITLNWTGTKAEHNNNLSVFNVCEDIHIDDVTFNTANLHYIIHLDAHPDREPFSAASFSNCNFYGNNNDSCIGMGLLDGSTVDITDCLFSNNGWCINGHLDGQITNYVNCTNSQFLAQNVLAEFGKVQEKASTGFITFNNCYMGAPVDISKGYFTGSNVVFRGTNNIGARATMTQDIGTTDPYQLFQIGSATYTNNTDTSISAYTVLEYTDNGIAPITNGSKPYNFYGVTMQSINSGNSGIVTVSGNILASLIGITGSVGQYVGYNGTSLAITDDPTKAIGIIKYPGYVTIL